jgi:hypothetical protein
MYPAPGRWARVAVPVLLACACNGRPLRPGPDAAAISTPPGGQDGAAGAAGSIGSGEAGAGGSPIDGSAGTGSPGDAGAGFCPRVDEPADGPPSMVPSAPAPTRVPFSCLPLPAAFFFPPPDADVPGQFSRCASFDVGAATSLAASADGSLVALVTGDGIVRLVEVASRQVIAVLASPRAVIDRVAFAPDTGNIMTLAGAQREVTLWRRGDWRPIWRMTLPGTPYYHLFGGGLEISPDGRSAVVSPGSDTFLIDVASGAVRAQRTSAWSAVLSVGYGWGGRRIVVAEPSLAAHCNHAPNGGTVTVLAADTLAPIATIADLGYYGDGRGWHGTPQFRASPTDDLVLLPAPVDDPAGMPLQAFRLSDGGALPASPLTTLPLAFMPDGASVLIADGRGALSRERVADGVSIAGGILGAAGPVAASADGAVVAIGGTGADLLRVWNGHNASEITTVCWAAAPIAAGYQQKPAALSSDGQSLALATGTSVKVLRRDGAVLAELPTPGSPTLSPSGALLAVQDSSSLDLAPAVVLRVADGAKRGEVPFDTWNWATFVFSPREDRVYSNGYRDGTFRMDVVDLTTGLSTIGAVPAYSQVIGTAGGCPVVYEASRGAWRSCGGCDDSAVGPGTMTPVYGSPGDAALSADGQYVAIGRGRAGAEVTVWRLAPGGARVAAVDQRPASGSWQAHDFPIAIDAGGHRLVIGGEPVNFACYSGPQFEILVHDVASGEVIDRLPPAPAAVDAAARTVAYGAQLWCAR